MLILLSLTSTLIGCLIAAIVSYKIIKAKGASPQLGYILIIALILVAVPLTANLDISWKNRVAEGLEMKFRETAASQEAQMNSELHDLSKGKSKRPKELTDYAKNKNVQILIFYRRPEDVLPANKVKDSLLGLGFQASASHSDFAGWRSAVPGGQIRIVSRNDQLDTTKLRTALVTNFPDRKDKIEDETGTLLAGNFHIRIY